MSTLKKAQHNRRSDREEVLSRGGKEKQEKSKQSTIRRRKQPIYTNINSNSKLNEGVEEYKKELDKKIKQAKEIERQKVDQQYWKDELQYNEGWDTGEYKDTFRIMSINVSGISKNYNFVEWDMILRTMMEMQADAFGIQEPDINFRNQSIKAQFRETTRAFDQHLQMETSYSKQLNNLEKKKGGTITCVTGRWANRGIGGGQDDLGRWSYYILQGRQGQKVTIITTYQVCQQKGGVGCTIYHQQQLDIEEKEYEAEKEVDVRKRFREDLKEFIRNQHSQGHTVILLADFNDDMNNFGNATNTFLRESGLKNVMTERHGEGDMPHTYDRGKGVLTQ